jgi:hypothetical protein
MLRPEVERHVSLWSYAGAAAGGVIGFIIANLPGLMVGAYGGKRLGAIRDAKGKSVASVFSQLGAGQKAEVRRWRLLHGWRSLKRYSADPQDTHDEGPWHDDAAVRRLRPGIGTFCTVTVLGEDLRDRVCCMLVLGNLHTRQAVKLVKDGSRSEACHEARSDVRASPLEALDLVAMPFVVHTSARAPVRALAAPPPAPQSLSYIRRWHSPHPSTLSTLASFFF